jgi:hypothetical protein
MYEIEVTDTFGGEANYCWVKRGHNKVPQSSRPDRRSEEAGGLGRLVPCLCHRLRRGHAGDSPHAKLWRMSDRLRDL